MNRRAKTGFTVIEMLVVLVLLGMVVTLLMQGLSYVLDLRIRFLDQLERQRVGMLQTHWVRQVCESLTPDQTDGEWLFSGEARRLQGLTLSPLQGEGGTPTPISLELVDLEGRLVLEYKAWEGHPLEIGHWSAREGEFQYLDDEGDWHEQWPPKLEMAVQLPAGLLLTIEEDIGRRAWFISLSGRRETRLSQDEILKRLQGE